MSRQRRLFSLPPLAVVTACVVAGAFPANAQDAAENGGKTIPGAPVGAADETASPADATAPADEAPPATATPADAPPAEGEASAPAEGDSAATDATADDADSAGDAPPAAEPADDNDTMAEPASTEGGAEGSEEDLEGFEAELLQEEQQSLEGASDEPSIDERRIVAFVATGVSAASLATGLVVGFMAWQHYSCLQGMVDSSAPGSFLPCEEPQGIEYLDQRAQVEQLSVIADMAFLFSAAAALVAGTGFVRGFLFTGEDDADAAAVQDDMSEATSDASPAVGTVRSAFAGEVE